MSVRDPKTALPEPRLKARHLAFVAGVFAMLAACAKVAGLEGLEVGDCKGGVCAEEAGAVDSSFEATTADVVAPLPEAGGFDGSDLPCPSVHGPTMIRVGTSGNTFCIDSTEVTVKDYKEFTTATNGDAGGQPAVCAWNGDYTAGFGGEDAIPVAGIDWCDARAYCAWAGKRLCGKQQNDKFAGSIATKDLNDFDTHEWLIACSHLGQLVYPYGGIHQNTACNTGENDAGRTLAVGSKKTCQGGFPGIYDMVGNVWEWFDGPCNLPDGGAADAGPAKDECIVKGGAFPNTGANLNCDVEGLGASRDRRDDQIGVRCCSD